MFACFECGKKFKFEQSVARHMKAAHSTVRKLNAIGNEEFTSSFFDASQDVWRANKVKIMNGAHRWSGAFRYGCTHRRTKGLYCKRVLKNYHTLCDFHAKQYSNLL
jgi:hypothetical protein